jgi:hypothetical protein
MLSASLFISLIQIVSVVAQRDGVDDRDRIEEAEHIL